MPENEDATKPQQIPHLKKRWAGNDLVLYNPLRGRMHVLNASAAFIWRLCDGSRSQEEMTDRLTAEFQIDEGEDPALDVRETLRFLSAEELIYNLGRSNSGPVSADSR